MRQKKVPTIVAVTLLLCLPAVAATAGCSVEPTPSGVAEAGAQQPSGTDWLGWEFTDEHEWTMYLSASDSFFSTPEAAIEWASGLEEATNGCMKIDVVPLGEHPYKQSELLRALRDGACDMATVGAADVADSEAGLAVLELPLLVPCDNVDSVLELQRGLTRSYFAHLWVNKWNGISLGLDADVGIQNLYMKDGFLEDRDSLTGKSIGVLNPYVSPMIEMVNGKPVQLDFSEAYDSVQSGAVDGLIVTCGGACVCNLAEVAPDVTWIPCSHTFTWNLMNRDSWAEVSPELQRAIIRYHQSTGWWRENGIAEFNGCNAREDPSSLGVAMKDIPPTLRDELREEAYDAIWKPWIDQTGVMGEEAFDVVARALVAMGETVPGYEM
jgi:TRAP-type C4-dicarboxylate transport system substrate-binding protein